MLDFSGDLFWGDHHESDQLRQTPDNGYFGVTQGFPGQPEILLRRLLRPCNILTDGDHFSVICISGFDLSHGSPDGTQESDVPVLKLSANFF